MNERLVKNAILLLFITRIASESNRTTVDSSPVYNISTHNAAVVTTVSPDITSLLSITARETPPDGRMSSTVSHIVSSDPTITTKTNAPNRTSTTIDHSVGNLSTIHEQNKHSTASSRTDSTSNTAAGNTKQVTKSFVLDSRNDSTTIMNPFNKVIVTKLSSTGQYHNTNTGGSQTTVGHRTTTKRTDSEGFTTGLTEESRDNITNSGRLQYVYDKFDTGDKLWPVGMALTIGIPTIIVLAVTITVLYKRQVAKPRSRLSFYGQKYAKM